jgi:hypothetical protein
MRQKREQRTPSPCPEPAFIFDKKTETREDGKLAGRSLSIFLGYVVFSVGIASGSGKNTTASTLWRSGFERRFCACRKENSRNRGTKGRVIRHTVVSFSSLPEVDLGFALRGSRLRQQKGWFR